jgi:hypothetical protein
VHAPSRAGTRSSCPAGRVGDSERPWLPRRPGIAHDDVSRAPLLYGFNAVAPTRACFARGDAGLGRQLPGA